MDELVTLTLPYPPSTNRYWRTFRGRTYVSSEATQYKKAVKLLLGHHEPYDGLVALYVTLHPKLTSKGLASKVCMDIDNSIKVCLDSLQGILIVDDKQVRELHAVYGEPVRNGAVTVRLQSL